MKKKNSKEFDEFDDTMKGLLSVPYSELQEKLEAEKKVKAKQKKRTNASASSRASSKVVSG